MSAGNVLNQMRRTDQVSDTPASSVERFTSGPNGQCALVKLGRESGDSGEWDVVKPIVDFIGQNDQVVFDSKSTDTLELLSRKYLADRVVTYPVSLDFLSPGCHCLRRVEHLHENLVSERRKE